MQGPEVQFDQAIIETPIAMGPYQTVNFHRWAPGTSLDVHRHDYWQIIAAVEGSFDVDWGSGWQRVPVRGVHILPVGCEHRIHSPSGHGQCGINFTHQPADERGVITALNLAITQPLVLLQAVPFDLLSRLNRLRFQVSVVDRLSIGIVLDAWILSLLERMNINHGAFADELLQVLQVHKLGPSSVAGIAEDMHMARSTVQAHCQVHFGCGLMVLHERLRLERAAALLFSQEELSIAEVAALCGYDDLATFSRRFKCQFKAAPSHWRHQSRNGVGLE